MTKYLHQSNIGAKKYNKFDPLVWQRFFLPVWIKSGVVWRTEWKPVKRISYGAEKQWGIMYLCSAMLCIIYGMSLRVLLTCKCLCLWVSALANVRCVTLCWAILRQKHQLQLLKFIRAFLFSRL